MTAKQKISFTVAFIGLAAMVFLEATHTPGKGVSRISVISGISALAIMRLYLFYEGTALIDVSRKKAKIAFILSLVLTGFLVAYGVIIHIINSEAFKHYQLALFLILTVSLAAVEWVFSERIGAESETALSKLKDRIESLVSDKLSLSQQVEAHTASIETLSNRVNTLSKENAKLSEMKPRVSKLEKLMGSNKTFHFTGRPYKLCPECMNEGKTNLLGGGTKSKVLVCEKHGTIKI